MENTRLLTGLLKQEIDAYSQILCIEREKEEAITANDPEKLLEVLQREEPAVSRANALEQEILTRRDALAQEAGKPAGITLREIIAELAPEESEEVERLRGALFGFAEEIRRINQTNYLLLKQSIELLDEVVSAVLGESVSCSTYEQDGRLKSDTIRQGTLSLHA